MAQLPKEKAKELVDKMSKQTYSYQPYAGAHYKEDEIGWEAGKKCALIALEGRMEELCILPYGMEYLDRLAYLEEIKEEINKL